MVRKISFDISSERSLNRYYYDNYLQGYEQGFFAHWEFLVTTSNIFYKEPIIFYTLFNLAVNIKNCVIFIFLS